MNVVLLSGGSGKRLWPLSNDVRAKQFLKIFKKFDGTKESMLQRMYRMIKEVDSDAVITIATSKAQLSYINSQLGKNIDISIEPARRDTFPAIALSTAYVYKKLISCGLSQQEAKKQCLIICPVDPYVDSDYFYQIKILADEVDKTDGGLVLMGIEPTYPSTKYGYIMPDSSEFVSTVHEFKEKPDVIKAEQYIKNGALWNAGVFAFKIDYLLNISRSLLGKDDYNEIF